MINFHKYLYFIGEKLKNPYLRAHYKRLMKTDKASIDELEALQLERLKALLSHAKENTNFYNDRLKDIDINTMTLTDLQKIPPLTKSELIEHSEDLKNHANGEKLISAETSGTSGQVFTFYKNIHWDASFRAAQYRGYSWYGVNPCQKSLYFWGFRKKLNNRLWIRFIDFMLHRHRFFDYNNEEFEKAAVRLRTSDYIAGYSSSIHMMAKYFHSKGYTFNNIKMVKGTAEKVYDSYHSCIQSVFGCKMTSEYGSAEAGVIAFECPSGNMHIVMENVIVEEIDDKILITNLWAYSLPFIRFELGDYIILDNETVCPCGREHKIIKEVTGRIGKQVHGKEGIFSSININHIFKYFSQKYDLNLTYSAKQFRKGEILFEIIDDETLDHEKIRRDLIDAAYEYFADDLRVIVKFLIYHEGKIKKQKDFESFIKDEIS